MSWRKRLNSVGDRTEPCGTPSLKGRFFDVMHVGVVDFVYKFMSGGGIEGFAYVYFNE